MTVSGEDPISEFDLLAYVDGHLDPGRRQEVERYLAAHPDDADRVAADLAINEGIHRLFDRYYRQPVPEAVRVLLDRPRQPEPREPVLARTAAALGLVVAGVSIGWLVASEPDNAMRVIGGSAYPPAVIEASYSHGGSSQGGGVQEAGSAAEGFRQAVRIPDLTRFGFRLAAQSLVGGARPAVQLVYEDREGGRIYAFLTARQDSDGRGGWTSGPVIFSLAGELPPDRLATLAQAIHNDLTVTEARAVATRYQPFR